MNLYKKNFIYKYISEYFLVSKKIKENCSAKNITVIQFFQKQKFAVFCGINEVLKLLKNTANYKNIKIKFLKDGTKIKEKEVVLEIEGEYENIAHYEGIIDGILSRSTSLATNAYLCVSASKNKEVVCMADRSDHYLLQEIDGYAWNCGGITSFSSVAQANSSQKNKIYRSTPHSFIQQYKGDIVKAMIQYELTFPNDDLIALVDYNNNIIDDSLKLLSHFNKTLKGVRVDTPHHNKDKMFSEEENEWGVTPNQIKKLRLALNKNNGHHVKIFVSSGFEPEKIKYFEKENTPVDGYGVGEYLLKINNTFCGDAVKNNGELCSKSGRKYKNNKNLILHKWE